MRRRILIIALALGTVLGFGAGFARLATCHRRADSTPEFLDSHRGGPGGAGWGGWRDERREAFERHVADVCADAALRARARAPAPPPEP